MAVGIPTPTWHPLGAGPRAIPLERARVGDGRGAVECRGLLLELERALDELKRVGQAYLDATDRPSSEHGVVALHPREPTCIVAEDPRRFSAKLAEGRLRRWAS